MSDPKDKPPSPQSLASRLVGAAESGAGLAQDAVVGAIDAADRAGQALVAAQELGDVAHGLSAPGATSDLGGLAGNALKGAGATAVLADKVPGLDPVKARLGDIPGFDQAAELARVMPVGAAKGPGLPGAGALAAKVSGVPGVPGVPGGGAAAAALARAPSALKPITDLEPELAKPISDLQPLKPITNLDDESAPTELRPLTPITNLDDESAPTELRPLEPITNLDDESAPTELQPLEPIRTLDDEPAPTNLRRDLPQPILDLERELPKPIRQLESAGPLSHVRYRFHGAAVAETRWRVVRASLVEELSAPYACVLDLANEDLDADPEALLGYDGELVVEREPLSRSIHGIVARVEHRGRQAGHLLCRVHLVPALQALDQRTDHRIYQNKTVPEILDELLTDELTPYGREWDLERLQRPERYHKREYTVCYGESALAFLQRLTEEEGIAFFFDHTQSTEVLCFIDLNTGYASCPTLDDGDVPIAGPEANTHEVETIRSFEVSSELRPTSAVVRDFDWTRPSVDLTGEMRGSDRQGRERETYVFAPLNIGSYQPDDAHYTTDDRKTELAIRAQLENGRARVYAGRGVVTGFAPGTTFTLAAHHRHELDRSYLITRVIHEGEAPEELTADTHAHAAGEQYANTFACIPVTAPFRPQRQAPRPRIYGQQTAMVVGPENEEIHTDEHGRIRIQFHWDRRGKRDANSTCWVRVAQGWSGAGFGVLFTPRIGSEVVVSFLDGNPDRPLVTGCVYNGEQRAPVDLPHARTQSAIRTRSSPHEGDGPVGFNELRFEDSAGQEEVFVHAQRDLREVVKHDHGTTVGRHQSDSVGENQTITVGGNRSKTVTKMETNKIDGDRHTDVKALDRLTVTGTQEITVTVAQSVALGKQAVAVGGGAADADALAAGDQLIDVGNDRTVNVVETDTLTAKNKEDTVTELHKATVGKYELHQGKTTFTFESGHVELDAHGFIDVHQGGDQLRIEEGKIAITAAKEFSVVCGASSMVMKNDGTIEIRGAAKVALEATASSVALEPSKISSSAPAINSAAMGTHEISGAIVKIN